MLAKPQNRVPHIRAAYVGHRATRDRHSLPRRSVSIALLLLAIIAIPGRSCGPFFDEAIFIATKSPDSLADFAAGKLGVIQSTYWKRHLVLAYRILNGKPLSPEEQRAALHTSAPIDYDAIDSGQTHWKKVRGEFLRDPKAQEQYFTTSRRLPGQDYESFDNCLDSGFETAAQTLEARKEKYASDQASLKAWVSGQDAVFSNCTERDNKQPEPINGGPQWLQKDRAYQVAAAKFYSMQYPAARADFTAIAQDQSSPWRDASAYLVGRAWVREASLERKTKFGKPTSSYDETKLANAAKVLQAVAGSSSQYAASASALLNHIHAIQNPTAYIAEVANRVAAGTDKTFSADLDDLNYYWTIAPEDTKPNPADSSDLMDWIATMREERKDAATHAVERWNATHSQAWLIAALATSKQPDEKLMTEAKSLQQSSPAWTTATFYRLKSQHDDNARSQLATLMPQINATQSRSTINAFIQLQADRATTLKDFLAVATRVPAGYAYDEIEDQITPGVKNDGKVTMAGMKVNAAGAPRFDSDAAVMLNEHLPLNDMVDVVLNGELPKQLQFELAQAAFTRAVLLDKPELVQKLTQPLVSGESGWKPYLDAINSAQSADDRHAAMLLALMRFPSVSPYVENGAGRPDGFVGYSAYRDNWWCDIRLPNSYEKKTQPHYAFLTAVQEKQAITETTDLYSKDSAAMYFATQVLNWVKAHPSDARNVELVGNASRVMRNACRQDKDKELNHQLFLILQKKYPNSTWAKRYKTWE